MSIEIYKILHLVSLILFISSLSGILLLKERSKLLSILFGVSSLILFIAGIGLLHKTGQSMHSPWILGKLGIWLLLAAAVPIVSKRCPEKKVPMLVITLILLCLAAILVILKP